MKEIIKNLPGSWHELKLFQYQKLTEILVHEGEEESENDLVENGILNRMEVIASLTGTSIETLQAMPMADLSPLFDKIKWLDTPPPVDERSKIKWKKINDITYNQYITFLQLQDDPLSKLHLILKDFSVNEMTEDEILNMPTDEVLSGFFLFKNQLKKSLKRSQKWQMMVLKMLESKKIVQQLLARKK